MTEEPQNSETPAMRLRLAFLGHFQAEDGTARTIAISAKKNRALLTILALTPRLTATRERIAGLLWGDRSDDQARNSLRQSLAVLRKELGETAASALIARDDIISLSATGVTIDVADFRKLSDASDMDSLRGAARLYRGALLSDHGIRDSSFEDWLAAERGHLHQTAIRLFDRLAMREAGVAKIEAAQRLLALDPLREASHRLLMQAHAESGEKGPALKQYEALKQVLHAELGVEPAAETQDLAKRITSGSVASAPPGAPPSASVLPSDRPAIAVLPFLNLSDDPKQEYFSDGIAEDIIIELSRFRDLAVIARNSSFAFKGTQINLAKMAAELNVVYVLEGSVRRSGNRMRVTAQLVDVRSSNPIWAERYDREIIDMFAVQDEITQKIVGMLAVGLAEDALERAKRKPPENLVAYEHWLRGRRLLWTVGNNNLEARRNFSKAAEADRNFPRAYSGLAVTYQMEALDFPAFAEARAAYDNAFAAGQKALALDESDYQAHICLAWPLLYRHDYETMKKHIDRALLLNPNDTDTLANATYLLMVYGEPERAAQCGETAMRLNPRYPDWYASFQSTALFAARRYEEAFALRIRSPDYFIDSTFYGAAILVYLGRLDEARQWADRAVARLYAKPGWAERATKGCIPLLLENNPFRRPEDREHFAEGMRRAGVPD